MRKITTPKNIIKTIKTQNKTTTPITIKSTISVKITNRTIIIHTTITLTTEIPTPLTTKIDINVL